MERPITPEDFGLKVDDLDERAKRFEKQREDRGWDDSETWSLDIAFAKWIVPRLERFREITIGHPMGTTEEKWDKVIGDMVDGFKIMIEDDCIPESKKRLKKVTKAIHLFHEHFFSLWW